ncbi:MAG: pyrimidine/purine nucleoside phosphorylase [Bacteroidales bacterium]|nr:pyrimidine/purine nucleoside phosphorylase [Bacteroidales bacterium]
MFEANQYFEGKVASLVHKGAEGKATVGVMTAGEYEFGTSTLEIMTVISGKMKVKLPGQTEWVVFGKFQSFEVKKDVSFQVSVDEDTPYLCLYK